MAKSRKSTPHSRRLAPQTIEIIRRCALHGGLALIVTLGAVIGLYFLRQNIEKRIAFPTSPLHLVIKDRPAWMTDAVADQILRRARPLGLHSAFDHQLLVDTAEALASSSWVREVRSVRRVYDQAPGDTIEIDCIFHTPIALVKWGDYYSYVDNQGVKLPEQFSESQLPRVVGGGPQRVNIRIIDGVKRPPPEPGEIWLGDDLAAGLALVKLLYGQDWADEIRRVDVSNVDGRVDPRESQIVLYTGRNTAIRWGQPIGGKGFEISDARKVKYLQAVVEQLGHVDANQPWIDIRFDKITYPSAQASAQDEHVQ